MRSHCGNLIGLILKTFLACLLILSVSVTAANASCYFMPLKPVKRGDEIIGSYDMKGEPHEFGSHWKTEDCFECSCLESGISCCTSYGIPVNFDEEKCVSIFDNTACAYEVVEKADHSKKCEVHEWVG
ncbi:beta-microseminoprotein A1-like [Excalfactoria chinensis]|uniref:beta-microseminoprotein A1-like n=1 Tax=Excalfactoria chinensis TaxID=46218 RepID=UPI003B3A207C